ncbi:protein cereblon [Prorops nasuta]|uniref:protein cereblon n=1 Tax=Prorops nasuta TaxID=863751 RepID=UPI0034CEBAC9
MNIDENSDAESNESFGMDVLDYSGVRQEQDVAIYSEISSEEVPLPTENTFDLALPATHSYLGQNLEELRGRTVLDDGIYMNLPLLVKQPIVLFPGQTLPMTVYERQTIEMLKTCIQNDRTFGVICSGYDKMMQIGTTAEIYEYKETNGELNLKAKGRQRFKILRLLTKGYGKIFADVRILPEVILKSPFQDERLTPLDPYRTQPFNEAEARSQEKIEQFDAAVTPWPAWLYRQYDPLRLSLRIRNYLKFIENRGSNIPKDPVELSYWAAQNLLLDNNERMIVLKYDCAISRLQREIKYLIEDRVFVCCNCDSFIGKQSDIFPMSKEGPQSAYCNSSGVIHETVTFYHAQGLILSNSPPSTECSWFPGYAWTIANCKHCGSHMGWKFTAVQGKLKPQSFWGLTRLNLKHKGIM